MRHFDIIIANPPYGAVGANITGNVLEKTDFGEFINLLPMSDYAKGDVDVAKHIVCVEDVEAGFEDAAVTTAIAVLSKTPVSDVSADKLKLRMKDFGILNKFFRKNAVSDYILPIRQRNFRGMENRFAVAIGRRDAAHGHLPYSRDTSEYLFNTKLIDRQEYERRVAETLYGKPTGNLTSDPIFFETEAEAENYMDFIYSEDGFRFTSMLWSTYKTDSSQAYEDCFPRVDWKKPQTVESILVAYDYSDSEIAEVKKEAAKYRFR